MSHSRRLVATMATLAVLLALPAGAAANVSPSSSAAAVRTHAVKAQKAIKRIDRAASSGNAAGVVRQLRIARSQTAAASRKARAMATGSNNVAAAQALTLAGTTYEQLISTITQLVDQVTGQAQAAVARAIKPSLTGQHEVIGVLSSLLDDMPAGIRPILASIVTALAAGDADEVANLDSAIDGGTLPANIGPIVTQALAMATQRIGTAFNAIKGIVPMLPAPAQGPMTQVLNMGTQTSGAMMPTALGTVTGLIDTILGSLSFTQGSSGSGGPASVFGGMLNGITGTGQGALPGDAGNILSKLLRQLFGGDPTSGSGATGGLISRIMELISSILGGLFGGAHQPAPAA